MTDRALARVAWATAALALVCAALGAVVHLTVWGQPGSPDNPAQVVFPLLGVLAFVPVGGLIAARQPRNAVCWVVLAFGADIGLAVLLDAIAVAGLVHPGEVPGASAAAWLGAFLWYLALGLLIPHLFLLFPTGRPPSPRWRALSVVSVVLLAAMVLVALRPGPLPDYRGYENPFGVAALESVSRAAEVAAWPVVLALLAGSALSLVVRFRRSRGVERLQLKWVTFTVATLASAWVVNAVPGLPARLGRLLEVVAILGLCAVPISIGIAVLRYRLYDIDRVINRTLVYGSLTVVLGLAYIGLVLVGQAVFSSVAGGGDLAIAVSTLVVAALFSPVRSRVQRVVDRRFYRRRYDAQRTLEAFGVGLRDEVELGVLSADLRGVVEETMQPTHVSLWLREGARS